MDPEQNFLICALDTLSGVVEALGPSIEPLVSRSNARDIVLQCCQVDFATKLGETPLPSYEYIFIFAVKPKAILCKQLLF